MILTNKLLRELREKWWGEYFTKEFEKYFDKYMKKEIEDWWNGKEQESRK